MKPSIALEQHHNAIQALAVRHTLHNVRVFGSVARGQDGEESDLDLLVDITPDVTTLMHIVEFKLAAEKLLGIPVDVRTIEDINERFRSDVASESMAL